MHGVLLACPTVASPSPPFSTADRGLPPSFHPKCAGTNPQTMELAKPITTATYTGFEEACPVGTGLVSPRLACAAAAQATRKRWASRIRLAPPRLSSTGAATAVPPVPTLLPELRPLVSASLLAFFTCLRPCSSSPHPPSAGPLCAARSGLRVQLGTGQVRRPQQQGWLAHQGAAGLRQGEGAAWGGLGGRAGWGHVEAKWADVRRGRGENSAPCEGSPGQTK
jgi:hypothetical protein